MLQISNAKQSTIYEPFEKYNETRAVFLVAVAQWLRASNIFRQFC